MPAGKHGRQGGPPWAKLVREVLIRDNYVCRTAWDKGCTKIATTGDHIVPLSKGGIELDPANVIAACLHCNLARGAKLLTDRPVPPTLTTSRDWLGRGQSGDHGSDGAALRGQVNIRKGARSGG